MPCLLHVVTGLHCPLCGMTRGVLAMLRGDLATSVAMHPLAPLVVVMGLIVGIHAVRHRAVVAVGGPLPVIGAVLRHPALWVILGVFAVVRNLPGMRFLAP